MSKYFYLTYYNLLFYIELPNTFELHNTQHARQIPFLLHHYLFKKIFRNELYLKKLLLGLFNIKANNISYLNTELVKTNKKSKVGIVNMLLNIDEK